MIVVDASCLFEVVTDSVDAEPIRARLAADPEHAAPEIVDVEVFGLIRRDTALERINPTLGAIAVNDLRSWPGDRFGHRALLDRMWELRENVRGWDAAYVALAEVLDATLLTRDRRLAHAPGPTCGIEVI